MLGVKNWKLKELEEAGGCDRVADSPAVLAVQLVGPYVRLNVLGAPATIGVSVPSLVVNLYGVITVTAGFVGVLKLTAAFAGTLLMGATGMPLIGLTPALTREFSALLFLGGGGTLLDGACVSTSEVVGA